MRKIRVAIVGYGNIGRYALQAIERAEDMECVGVVRRSGSRDGYKELELLPVVDDIKLLDKVDVAIISTPSRLVQEYASRCLSMGISTVDSFDIHTSICELRRSLDPIAKASGCTSIISSGWDPGTDSVLRALLLAMAPEGETYTNFGPGRSMGHTVVAKSVKGVKNALSMTIPEGKGVHSRRVYVELEDGVDFEEVAQAIRSDHYFASDLTSVIQVDDVEELNTMNHGVEIVREGIFGACTEQKFDFTMRINNPALTGQILVAAARAAVRQKAGCYTLIEIPVIDLLPGNREALVKSLV